ncbi:hypothetical protein D2N39_11565 [Gemmobacter lutimaris]|uniref:Thymidylate synthase n=1 Tax=Gemmobacter lutimaris TaxID=2306023 RepID=A0A398BTT2_9RHOB|nr:FAD-dependent thymidylate synthase [Gemmobacter lutimaris]RID91868.1 hypothetical protein D2N39_11565 [Gemmobacter lutimaris]
MTITAKVIQRSRQASGDYPDLITLQLRYPRFIHAEAKTHRLIRIDDAEYEFLQEISLMDDENLSRNASSSRAVPVERMIQDVLDDPAMPVAWGSNKPGMQAGAELAHWPLARDCWLDARDAAVARAKEMLNLGAHKQIVNRLLEPFGHISVVVTATEWDNFFALRCHADADPTMRALAEAMRAAIAESEPTEAVGLETQRWHLPYTMVRDWDYAFSLIGGPNGGPHPFRTLAMISAARCARVSYLNHDGTAPDVAKDLALARRLLESRHMSPFEHQGQAPDPNDMDTSRWGNFTGWDQFRKIAEIATTSVEAAQ